MIFRTYIIWCNRIHSFKYLRSATLGSKDKGITKSEFVTQTYQNEFSSFFLILRTFYNFFHVFFSCGFFITTKRFGSSWSIPTFAKYDMEHYLDCSILLYFVLMDLIAWRILQTRKECNLIKAIQYLLYLFRSKPLNTVLAVSSDPDYNHDGMHARHQGKLFNSVSDNYSNVFNNYLVCTTYSSLY